MSHREFDIKMRRRSSKLNGVSCLAPALHETFYCPIKWILMKAVIAFSNTAHQNWLWQSRGWNPSLLMFSWRSLFSGFCFLTLSQPEPTQQPEPSTHHASFAVRHSQTFSWTSLMDWFWLRLAETASWKLRPMQDSHSHNLWFQLPTHISHVWWSGRINNLWDVFM